VEQNEQEGAKKAGKAEGTVEQEITRSKSSEGARACKVGKAKRSRRA